MGVWESLMGRGAGHVGAGARPNPLLSLQLNRSAVLGPAVGLLRLPRTGAKPPAAGVRCRVAGWGSISSFEESPAGLMEAEVRVLGLDACNSSWKGQLSPTMLCTRSGDRRRRGFCAVRCSWHYSRPEPAGTGQA